MPSEKVTAHRCLLPVPHTCQLWSFVCRNYIYLSQKSDHCTYVLWYEKKMLATLSLLNWRQLENIHKRVQVGQGSNILPPGRKQLFSLLPQLPQVLQVQVELLSLTTCGMAAGYYFIF